MWTNLQRAADFVIFVQEILNGKYCLLWKGNLFLQQRLTKKDDLSKHLLVQSQQ